MHIVVCRYYIRKRDNAGTIFDEVFQKKVSIIEKNKDHIEEIRRYIENLDYEEFIIYDEQEIKVGNLRVTYREGKDCGFLILNTQEVLKDIGIRNRYVVDPEGTIRIEFDITSYEIRKISIAIEYKRLGYDTDGIIPSHLAWYVSDYKDREYAWAVLDDNWQIEN